MSSTRTCSEGIWTGGTENQGWRSWDEEPPSIRRLLGRCIPMEKAHSCSAPVSLSPWEGRACQESKHGALPSFVPRLFPHGSQCPCAFCDRLWGLPQPQPHSAELSSAAGPGPAPQSPGPDRTPQGLPWGRAVAPSSLTVRRRGRHREKPERRCQTRAEQTPPGSGLWKGGGRDEEESQGRGSSGGRRLWEGGRAEECPG